MVKSPTKFLKEVRGELNQVTWPPQKEVVRLTGTVVLISLIVGVYIGILDLLFTKLIQLLIGR